MSSPNRSLTVRRSSAAAGSAAGDLGARLIAFYLPQFHPIPENDAWWGKGFTEWTNVTRARPRFPGHHQPHLPADLGFYDLRVPEVRAAQAALARSCGIQAFCYYHYWFGGKRLLQRPFDEVLKSGEPDFPFCLCWANENWTRAWDGGDREILMAQRYSAEDDRRHLQWLAAAFADDRYVRIDGKPLLLVYRASLLPDARRTTDVWRDEALRLGIGELFLACVQSFFGTELYCPASRGFDAAVEFQPGSYSLGEPLGRTRRERWPWKLCGKESPFLRENVYSYGQVVEQMLAMPPVEYLRFPCVTPMWDNSARRQHSANILHGSTPQLYEYWLYETLVRTAHRSPEQRLCFINAWNEWAEGNHLEPCQKWGCAYLDATRNALARAGEHRQAISLDGQSVAAGTTR